MCVWALMVKALTLGSLSKMLHLERSRLSSGKVLLGKRWIAKIQELIDFTGLLDLYLTIKAFLLIFRLMIESLTLIGTSMMNIAGKQCLIIRSNNCLLLKESVT